MKNKQNHLIRDALIIFFSVVLAVLLVKTGMLSRLLISAEEWRILGAVVAGMFFVSLFTVAPASAILFELATSGSVWEVAVFGGIGAVIGDFFIFQFVKNGLSEDVDWLLQKTRQEKLVSFFQRRHLTWLMPLIGGLIVASPFPDEIGLALMGFSKLKTSRFILLSFFLNSIGILLLGFVAKGVLKN